MSSVLGDTTTSGEGSVIRICGNCGRPTLIDNTTATQTPGAIYGEAVERLPEEVSTLYREARVGVGGGSFNAAVLLARKLLMHVAVDQGADQGGTFLSYVDYLVDNGHIPPSSRAWVDEIRKVGNQANHEISPISKVEAETMVDFVAMLLKLTYEYPARARRAIEATAAREADADN